jgi:histidinol-phosphatase (PHP family)
MNIKPRPLVNFHTHTFRCRHAAGDAQAYAAAALTQNLTTLGFSDHTPLPDNRWHSIRMNLDELPGYCDEVRRAAAAYPNLRIFSGLECEYDIAYLDFYRDVLLKEYRLDFLAGGAHWFPYRGNRLSLYDELETASHLAAYAEHLIASMEAGLFDYIAHPDFFARSHTRWDADAIAASRDILSAAAHTGVPLEINTNGFRKDMIDTEDGPRPGYPLPAFWTLAAEYGVKVIVNSDAHQPADVGALAPGLDLAGQCGLTPIDLSRTLLKKRT